MQGGQGQARVSPETERGLPFACRAPDDRTRDYVLQELRAKGQ